MNAHEKVIILAGGWGTRLGQMAEIIPKPMVAIGNRPVLWHIMKTYSHYGFNEFIVALGVKGQAIKQYFYDFEALNNDFTIDLNSGQITYHNKHGENQWKVTLVDTGLNTLKGGRIKRLEKYLPAETNFVTYGDGVADVDIKSLLEFHHRHGKIITITGVHAASRFGELEEKDGRVLTFTEKPLAAKSYINGGYMVFSRRLLDYLTPDESCDFEIGPLEKLAQLGEVMVYKHDGQWDCMDHERDVLHLNKLWSEGRAFWKVWDK